jgi:hypothetical protein
MRLSTRAGALVLGTVGLGVAVLAVAGARTAAAPLAPLALLAAAVVLTELFQVSSDDGSIDPVDAHIFSCSSAVHLAAVMLLGPWPAALIAAFGVVLVDGLRGSAWRHMAFNASAFALAVVGGGFAFELLGGVPGRIDLPRDFLALAALPVAYTVVNAALVNSVIALESASWSWPEVLRIDGSSRTAEAGLGAATALVAIREPWGLVLFVPLVVAVYQAHARLAQLRRETARALETFANVVDERDPYTYRHSARVAEYVRQLGQRLGLRSSEVARLRWAGRLHDLGKIAVDAGVLRKPDRLDGVEWAAMHRHPRLSARLLRRFRFAADEARAVEYHHERFDGAGYYGIARHEVPLAAHFIVVADSYDAMTTDRPYRPRLSREEALSEIEGNAGTQFHPAVARAFVAMVRGRDPVEALAEAELAELRSLRLRRRQGPGSLVHHLSGRPDLIVVGGIVVGLAAAALGEPALGLVGLAGSLAGLTLRELRARRARRVAAAVRIGPGRTRAEAFEEVASRLAGVCDLRWAGLVAWEEAELGGAVAFDWGDSAAAPTDVALSSWLIREAESGDGLLRAAGAELGRSGTLVALPLRPHGPVEGFLVLAFPRSLPAHVEQGLRVGSTGLTLALAEPPAPVRPLRPNSAAAAS